MADTHGRHYGNVLIVDRAITYDRIAFIVGAKWQSATETHETLGADCVQENTRSGVAIPGFEDLQT